VRCIPSTTCQTYRMDPTAADSGTPYILVVDDTPHSLRVLHGILKGLGEIGFAKSGEEALDRIAERMPDLVLLDAQMPGMGGYATCAAIKADAFTADLPVMFVTANTDTVSETEALSLGAADFIRKPVNPPVVLARVRTQLALKAKTDVLRELTSLDALTGIANRRAFDEAIVCEWRRAQRRKEPISLLMMDVDFFKAFNDTYGHPAGDVCLRHVAGALQASARRAGDLVARYGGEEFVAILPATAPHEALIVAERMRRQVRELGIAHGRSDTGPVVTLSGGLATIIPDADRAHQDARDGLNVDHEPLLRLADNALYEAKRRGRNTVIHLTRTMGVLSAAAQPAQVTSP